MSLAMPVGLVISGPVSEKFGVPLWFLISGVVIVAVTLMSYLYIKKEIR